MLYNWSMILNIYPNTKVAALYTSNEILCFDSEKAGWRKNGGGWDTGDGSYKFIYKTNQYFAEIIKFDINNPPKDNPKFVEKIPNIYRGGDDAI